MRALLLALFAALCLAGPAVAGPVDAGAAAWADGDIEGALSEWQPSADGGWGSGRVKFDVGNAYYRRGDLPRAIAYWRAAGVYRPRTSGVAHNLALARSELTGVPTPVGAPAIWMRILTPGELGLLGLALATLGSGLLVTRRRRQAARWPGVLASLGGSAVVALAVWGWWAQANAPLAVVVDGPAIARSTPDAGAESRMTLEPGAEVAVVQSMRGFLLVETGEDERGWVPEGAVLRIPR
jgi:hypothetical protein